MKKIPAYEITDKITGKRLSIVRARSMSKAHDIYRASMPVKGWQPETVRIYKVNLIPKRR